jgi:hypothetical protein
MIQSIFAGPKVNAYQVFAKWSTPSAASAQRHRHPLSVAAAAINKRVPSAQGPLWLVIEAESAYFIQK